MEKTNSLILIFLISFLVCFAIISGLVLRDLVNINNHLAAIQASTTGTDNISHSIEAQLEFMSEDVSVGPHSLIIK